MQAELDSEYIEYVSARLAALRRFAFLLCGDEHRADDLVQLAITRLYERWRRARTASHLDQYVRTILVRAFLDEKRRAWSARVSLVGQTPERPAPEEPDIAGRTVLRDALAKVPRRQQAVLVLRFLCDLPVDEVLAHADTGWVRLPYQLTDQETDLHLYWDVAAISDDARVVAGRLLAETGPGHHHENARTAAVVWHCH